MRLLFIAPFPYGPSASHGGAVVAHAQIELLASKHEIGVVCFRVAGVDEIAAEYLRKHVSFYQEAPLRVRRWKTLLARCRSVVTAMPLDALLHRNNEMKKAIHMATKRFRPDLVIIQFPQMAQYVEEIDAIPCVMDVEDAFSVSSFRTFVSQVGFIRKLERFLNWLFWIRYERKYYPRFDMVFTLTEQDLNGLQIFSSGLAGVSVGVPVNMMPRQENIVRNPLQIAFIGSFGHFPNVQGVRFFIEQVLPIIQLRVPGVQFLVAGKAPPQALENFASDQVRFIGFVPDLATFLAESGVVVIPLLSGGGIKIKTLEALAAGAPVVSTSIGVEGTGALNEQHLLVRDQASAFAEAVVALLADPQRAARLGAAGQALMRQRYSPEAWGKQVNEVLLTVANKKNHLGISE